MSTPLSRRDFIRNAATLAGSAGAFTLMPASVARAMTIEPEPGSSFFDAEHVVILMQENRSFDHVYGTLSGVRGFDDPRGITLADGNPVWLQTDKAGRTFAPWWLDIHGTRSTWTSCLPHGRGDQLAAAADGRHDGWLDAKKSWMKELALRPLCLGHYDRRDIPFYYAMADAFTVFDQNFSSICTSTYPNRAFFWSGTNRDIAKPGSTVVTNNSQFYHTSHVSWKTFPERLEEHGVSWKQYVNEIDLETGMSDDENYWLGSFTCNVLEYYDQYRVEFMPRRRAFVAKRIPELKTKIAGAKSATTEKAKKAQVKLIAELASLEREAAKFTPEAFEKLTEFEKNIHRKAFTTNEADPDFRKLSTITYEDKGKQRTDIVPAGDVLYQFRKDVDSGRLPTVSWLVAPAAFSDHPSSAWFGAWYLSEVFDILTKNPEVWKKTVFILTYDENDGYYDHVPPFTPPKPGEAATGAASEGLDTRLDFDEKGHATGFGFRVPMVIASPWTRGGQVCSQITDHTSVLRFLEVFLTKKTGKAVVETNISPWRRTVCGDLTAAFRSGKETGDNPKALKRDEFVASIYRAEHLENPAGYRRLTPEDIAKARTDLRGSGILPRQEPGSRPSVALPYELYADAKLDRAAGKIRLNFSAGKTLFGADSLGAPYRVYSPGKYDGKVCASRDYVVKPGGGVAGEWDVAKFEGGRYLLRAHGPNGFWREFAGSAGDPALEVSAGYGATPGNFTLRLANTGRTPLAVTVRDVSYGLAPRTVTVAPQSGDTLTIPVRDTAFWYDLSVTVSGAEDYSRRYAGRVETGRIGVTDPIIGRA